MMLVNIQVPGTNLGFSYDPYKFTALPTWERQFGFVSLESRYDGLTRIMIRKLNVERLPEHISQCFHLDLPGIIQECGQIQVNVRAEGIDFERTVWTGEYKDGARSIIRQAKDSWMVSALGPPGDATELGWLVTELEASIRISPEAQRNSLTCPFKVYGGLCRVSEGDYSVILDMFIGPPPHDLHLSSIQIEPDPRRRWFTCVLQGRQILLYSRMLFQGRTNWGSAAVPANGFAIVQLPKIRLGPNPRTTEGKVIVKGWWDNGQELHDEVTLKTLPDQIVLARPTPRHWMSINGPDEVSIHRLTVTVVNNHLYAAQRGAVDLINPEPQQREDLLEDDVDAELSKYPSFGETVLAPCSGRIIRCRSDLADQPVGVRDRQNPRGNEINIRMDNGFVVVLAHLRNGSTLVREGEYVQKGQKLAQVGNSGQSSEPHLHIHVADSEDELADGVIFRFEDDAWGNK